MRSILDVQQLRAVAVDETARPDEVLHAEVLVVGGGLGGVAAALAAGQAGRTLCLTEETDWLGGQATSQGVSALDENRYIETSGGTRSYQRFREGIRDWYRRNARLTPEAAANTRLNPGRGWVSALCFEPRAAVDVLNAALAPLADSGHLRVRTRTKAFRVNLDGQRVASVDFVNLESSRTVRVTCAFVLDATELGDLLALGAADFVTGAESRADTAEPHAADTADPGDVQSFTYTFALERCPVAADLRVGRTETAATRTAPAITQACGAHDGLLVKPPADYAANRTGQPYTLVIHYNNRGDIRYGVFKHLPGSPGAFWTYRRLIDAAQFLDPHYPNDLAMINWPGNDYRGGNILVDSSDEQIRQLRAAKDLSLGLLYWLQHDVQRDEGGRGSPELLLRRDVMDTADGLSKFPYIRESRRVRAVKTILEQELTSREKGTVPISQTDAKRGQSPRAAHFPDSVGIGLYPIDLHESKRGRQQVIDPTRPFQIPLGALIPRGRANLLAACKNIGTTHITNGCYRLHPVEWNIGESAGTTAALCVELGVSPAALRDSGEGLRQLQLRLVRRGVPIMWYDDVPTSDARFERVQMLPFDSPEVLGRLGKDLHAP